MARRGEEEGALYVCSTWASASASAFWVLREREREGGRERLVLLPVHDVLLCSSPTEVITYL